MGKLADVPSPRKLASKLAKQISGCSLSEHECVNGKRKCTSVASHTSSHTWQQPPTCLSGQHNGAGEEGCQWERLTLVSFPAGCPIDLACAKLAGKITNHDHFTAGCCNCCKCELVAKRSDCGHVIVGMLAWPELLRTGCNHHSFSAVVTWSSSGTRGH